MTRPRAAAAAVLAALTLPACATVASPPARTSAAASSPVAQPAEPLPKRSPLAARARLLRGPRVMNAERTHGRALTMFGNARAGRRLLIAGCVNGTACAGTDVVHSAMLGCPPPDAELWYFPSLDPRGGDLDATPAHPGAQAFRQAVADLRPDVAIVFRTGAQALVRGGDAARRYARLARLPYTRDTSAGLAVWAATALPRTDHVTVELPPGRASKRTAARLAYAIDRLAGTRFAQGAEEDRRRLIALGEDPRAQN